MSAPIFLDLCKSFRHLDVGKLVKKPVQVKGKNGKTFTRMQWVSPAEASTGNGVRKIGSEEGLKTAFSHGIHEHPDFEAALKDQGVDLATHDFKKHPHFFLPETKESAAKAKGYKDGHYPHEETILPMEHKPYQDSDFEPKKPKVQPKKEPEEEKAYLKHAKDPRIAPLAQAIVDMPLENVYDGAPKFHALYSQLLKRKKVFQEVVSEHIENDPDASEHSKTVQLRNLDIALSTKNLGVLMTHPTIARLAVNKLLGKKMADNWRKALKSSNLTINCNTDVVDDILSDGYKCSTLDNYDKKNLPKEDYDKLQEIISDASRSSMPTENALDEIKAMETTYRDTKQFALQKTWSEIYSRAEAESRIGLEITDSKPCYVAYNPMGEATGGVTYYGDGHVIVHKSILADCTATSDDSFDADVCMMSKVYDMDHLMDAFMLRQVLMDKNPHDHYDWLSPTYNSEIRMELQYHKPEIGIFKLDFGAYDLE